MAERQGLPERTIYAVDSHGVTEQTKRSAQFLDRTVGLVGRLQDLIGTPPTKTAD